jgi:hypothetical protein
MENDKFTKVVLTAIAVLLFVSVAQNAGWVCDSQSRKSICTAEQRSQCKAHARGDAPNYRLLPLAQGRKVLRLDNETGQVWYIDTRGMKGWRPIETLTDEEIAEIEDAQAGVRSQAQGRKLAPKVPAVKPKIPAADAPSDEVKTK